MKYITPSDIMEERKYYKQSFNIKDLNLYRH